MSGKVWFEIGSDARKVSEMLSRARGSFMQAICRAMDLENQLAIGHISKARLSKRGPDTLGVVSGRLRSSLRATKAEESGDGITSEIGSNVKYAAAHEYGTKPYTIRPKNKKALRFSGRHGPVFAKLINHPGLPARAPIQRGVEERQNNYVTTITKAMEKAWSDL